MLTKPRAQTPRGIWLRTLGVTLFWGMRSGFNRVMISLRNSTDTSLFHAPMVVFMDTEIMHEMCFNDIELVLLDDAVLHYTS